MTEPREVLERVAKKLSWPFQPFIPEGQIFTHAIDPARAMAVSKYKTEKQLAAIREGLASAGGCTFEQLMKSWVATFCAIRSEMSHSCRLGVGGFCMHVHPAAVKTPAIPFRARRQRS
jgi:hypothetical protein